MACLREGLVLEEVLFDNLPTDVIFQRYWHVSSKLDPDILLRGLNDE